MSKRISRSTFLKAGAGAVAAAASGKVIFDFLAPSTNIPCRMLGPSMASGHMLRDRKSKLDSTAPPAHKKKVIIVGGGISGLSTAWWLKRNNFDDFLLFELEKAVGGNSSSGKNQYGAYPWGAHYVPLANQESQYVKVLFEELGVIQGYEDKLPIYNELYLCHEPQERLFKDGTFQEGLVPKRGLQDKDRNQMERFFKEIERLRSTRGQDGRPAFAIPVAFSSQDDAIVSLDKLSMKQWLDKNGFDSKPLLWYVNYCCRDDYGASTENVSAWAGLHYFAGRQGHAANSEANSVVTWPEGNGFLVDKLRANLTNHIITDAFAMDVSGNGNSTVCTFLNTKDQNVFSTHSDFVVFAAPRFMAKYIIRDYATDEKAVTSKDLTYAPWLVANVTLKRIPSSEGVELCWDNVSYYSDSLGYVVSNHQNIVTRQGPTVVTYYYPLSGNEPREGRQLLLKQSAKQWSDHILKDLERMHPGITSQIISMDMWPWGHGMIRPSPGFIWGETRQRMTDGYKNVLFAHSDMSGISNFEEAQYHGVQAAKAILQRVTGA